MRGGFKKLPVRGRKGSPRPPNSVPPVVLLARRGPAVVVGRPGRCEPRQLRGRPHAAPLGGVFGGHLDIFVMSALFFSNFAHLCAKNFLCIFPASLRFLFWASPLRIHHKKHLVIVNFR